MESELKQAMAGAGVHQQADGTWEARVGWCKQVGRGPTAHAATESLQKKVKSIIERRNAKAD